MLITVYITHTLYKCKRFYMSGYLKQWQWNRWKIQRDQWNPGNIITFFLIETLPNSYILDKTG